MKNVGSRVAAGKRKYPGTGFIDCAGYRNCILLENAETRVVLGHHCGGRVLEYSFKGRNAVVLDPKQDGWVYSAGKPEIDPYGGRFDLGPEMTIPKHPLLWLGEWQPEIIGPRQARLTSRPDSNTGVQLMREFKLDRKTSRLLCRQTIKNISRETKKYCHWSRTLAPGGGICLIPLTRPSRFPKSYVMYGPGPVINYQPADPNIRIRDGFLEITGPPANPKLGLDSSAGWFAYLLPGDLMFVKKFPVYPERVYNEIAAITISIYYLRNKLCELEPIGPQEILKPGECAAFQEEWRLLEYPFPAGPADLRQITELKNSDQWSVKDKKN